MKLEEIEETVNHIRKQYIESLTFHWSNIDQLAAQLTTAQLLDAYDYLLSLVKQYGEGIGHIKEMGHNNDCLMCAMKDTLVNELLDEPEG